MPRFSFEELEIRTSDGAVLRALVDDPAPGQNVRATLVLAHAMFGRKTSFGRRDRPGLSSAFGARGFRTIAFDFRGHGDSSAPHDDWGYDDLVRTDFPAVIDYAQALPSTDAGPIVVVGHALGGHVALASQATGRISVDAIVAVGANVWVRELEPSRLRWAAKLALARAAKALIERTPGDPWLRERVATVMGSQWASLDGRDDYLAALRRVTAPVAAVLGERDRLHCHPAAGEAFARRVGGPVEIFLAPVGHRDLLTNHDAQASVIDAVEWALARVGDDSR